MFDIIVNGSRNSALSDKGRRILEAVSASPAIALDDQQLDQLELMAFMNQARVCMVVDRDFDRPHLRF